MLKQFVLVLGLFASMALVGCESMGMHKHESSPTTMASAPMADKMMVASTSQGSVVFLPGRNGTVVTYSKANAQVCDVCKSDAMAYFVTGKAMAEKCTVCGASRSALLMHGNQ